MKKNLTIFLVLGLFWPSFCLSQPIQGIARSTPGATHCTNGQPCSPATNLSGDLYIAPDVGGTSLAPMTPIAEVTVVATLIPTAYPTVAQWVGGGSVKSLTIDASNLDQDISCSFVYSTPIPFTVPKGSVFYRNYANGRTKMTGDVRCIHPGTIPSANSLRIYGEK